MGVWPPGSTFELCADGSGEASGISIDRWNAAEATARVGALLKWRLLIWKPTLLRSFESLSAVHRRTCGGWGGYGGTWVRVGWGVVWGGVHTCEHGEWTP